MRSAFRDTGLTAALESSNSVASIHQQIWVREGSIEVTAGDVVHPLVEDDCLAMQLNVPTAFRNRTRKAARYIVVIATERPRAGRR